MPPDWHLAVTCGVVGDLRPWVGGGRDQCQMTSVSGAGARQLQAVNPAGEFRLDGGGHGRVHRGEARGRVRNVMTLSSRPAGPSSQHAHLADGPFCY